MVFVRFTGHLCKCKLTVCLFRSRNLKGIIAQSCAAPSLVLALIRKLLIERGVIEIFHVRPELIRLLIIPVARGKYKGQPCIVCLVFVRNDAGAKNLGDLRVCRALKDEGDAIIGSFPIERSFTTYFSWKAQVPKGPPRA